MNTKTIKMFISWEYILSNYSEELHVSGIFEQINKSYFFLRE